MNLNLGDLLYETDWPVELDATQRQELLKQKINRAIAYHIMHGVTVKRLANTTTSHDRLENHSGNCRS